MFKQVVIDGERWEVRLSEDKQLSFSYAIPREKSEWKNNPLWFDWDYAPEEEEWSYTMDGVSNIHPIKLKRILFKLIVDIIKESKTTSFYFKPTNNQRGRIYSNLVNKLLEELGPGWSSQDIESRWFYFNKDI